MGRRETERGGVWRLKTEDGWRVNGPEVLGALKLLLFWALEGSCCVAQF